MIGIFQLKSYLYEFPTLTPQKNLVLKISDIPIKVISKFRTSKSRNTYSKAKNSPTITQILNLKYVFNERQIR